MGSGIKQGASESPQLFSFAMELALVEASTQYCWGRFERVLPELEQSDLLFMDDGILWTRECGDLQCKIEEFSRVLRNYGLALNLRKCQLYYCTPRVSRPHLIRVDGVTLEGRDEMEVMGLQFSQGQSLTQLIQPLLTRAQTKFWSIKHLLRGRAPTVARLKLFHRVVSNSALWCVSAFPPDKGALKAMNTKQALLIGWLLKLGRRADETWLSFRHRIVRSARSMMVKAGIPRWSTCWLERWWGFAGHGVRAVLRDEPPLSSILDATRTWSWWNLEKLRPTGARHPHHYPRLTNLELSMNKACAGMWREFAHDRGLWAEKLKNWIEQNDLPWASGLQLCLTDF